ncbi:hypothetical protein KXW65_000646 [Aspergillus fumigatus]|nr:hypothetical protein KXX67_002166 [Aspergillus fumigatus]KAH1451296.1 hypothetical protein KXX58_004226 [Aspergillus fumigatus]KAH1613835.1 hypothetical protein KXX31_004222 [Aspergillus fumigatus]KAH1844528.1 hypothetical protein KXX55_002692 [Aspergillus fumigatus]KAH1871201.1 hypothetical protein KXX01_008267 [Aspergillus fumigatus]
MTPGSPDEALHFRGKTLTPESPRPLHVAEPTKIPVLQNQMDPVFNDTSTYFDTPLSDLENGSQMHHQNGHYAESENVTRYQALDHHHYQEYHQPPPSSTQTQGSFHTGSLQADDQSVDKKNETSLSAGTATAKPSLPSNQSAVADEDSSTAPAIAANSSLTVLPSSDPAAPLAHPNPDVPPSASSQAAQILPVANEVNHAVASWAAQSAPHDRLDYQAKPEDNTGEGGVDFQNLLDNLPPPSTAAPSPPLPSETAPSSADDVSEAPQGLPPRPPPQEKPSIHPNYHPTDDIRSYHQLHPHPASTSTTYPSQQSNYQSNLGLPSLAASGAPGTASGASSLPPPPGPSFQQPAPSTAESSQEPPATAASPNGRIEKPVGRVVKPGDEDVPWGPDVQKKYDQFLHDERVYVTEGLWDRFPAGSRLFVGNLPTERVTKRDLFHIFHQYGKLAQISIKQAYGFIQFVDASACKHALDCEQGAVTLRFQNHRGILGQDHRHLNHLVVLHPGGPGPRNTAEADLPAAVIRGLREIAMIDLTSQVESHLVTLEMSRTTADATIIDPLHDRHLHVRSEEEMGTDLGIELLNGTIVVRDAVLGHHMEETDGIGLLAPGAAAHTTVIRTCQCPGEPRETSRKCRFWFLKKLTGRLYRVAETFLDGAILMFLFSNFIFHVENAFRNRGLRVDVLVLGPRIPLNAAVQRQIKEGVLAVVRLSRPNQFSRKIPLQVFDRSGGPDNVRFNEYPEVEPNIAAEIIFHAQAMQRGATSLPFQPNPAFAMPSLPTAPIPQAPLPAVPASSNVANVISSLDGPTLQSLLSALQQRQQQPVPAAQPFTAGNMPHTTADLASLLSGATRPPIPTNPQQHLPPQYSVPVTNAPVVPDPNLISLLTKGLGGQQQPQQQNLATVNPHVQNIMNQLSKWKQ